jgi:predicted aldo/keto reductase-like oxidoreductase
MIQTNLAGHARTCFYDMLETCVKEKIGLIGMKPYAGGVLLQPVKKIKEINIPKYKIGTETGFRTILPERITPVRCLTYALSLPGIATLATGLTSTKEVDQALAYLNATTEQRDFAPLLDYFYNYESGVCVYCNHCLPCPAQLDIGEIIRFIDMWKLTHLPEIKQKYRNLTIKILDCTHCLMCESRCPFDVKIMMRFEEGKRIFHRK